MEWSYTVDLIRAVKVAYIILVGKSVGELQHGRTDKEMKMDPRKSVARMKGVFIWFRIMSNDTLSN
jgi:hypothetical protein